MKIVLAGGSGQVGRILRRALECDGHACVVLTRRPDASAPGTGVQSVVWDGRSLGPWAAHLDGADAVINLAGRSVDCRYTPRHLEEMTRSRVNSTRAIGAAIAAARRPPRVWVQAGTATIYAHTFGPPHDEVTGRMGGDEPDAPPLWRQSVAIAQAWEAEIDAALTPQTRKVVLRSAMIMSPDRGGVFRVLEKLCRCGAGRQGNGNQFVSWIHDEDFVRVIQRLLVREDLAGVFNVCSPHPLPNRDFMAGIHHALHRSWSVPLPSWLLAIGALLLRTETELILKSRRVVPGRLLADGFAFTFPDWPAAAADLVARRRRHD